MRRLLVLKKLPHFWIMQLDLLLKIMTVPSSMHYYVRLMLEHDDLTIKKLGERIRNLLNETVRNIPNHIVYIMIKQVSSKIV